MLRRRQSMTQDELAERSGVSRSVISRIERGELASCTLQTLRLLGSVLALRVEFQPRWLGGELDRLLDAAHAGLVEQCVRALRAAGWTVAPEVSFSIYGERGSIDVLAWHARTRTLLVVEVKSRVVDVQDTLLTLDRKRRLAARIGGERGWDSLQVSVWLAVAGTRTNRRRIAAHRETMAAAFPSDGRALAGWLRRPLQQVSILSFLPISRREGT
jgi:transcriptional regulator with XRE-family HTH domain